MQNLPDQMLTVIIPVHNRPQLIRRTIESVVAQSYRPFSLIVVDNNSTDNTLDVVRDLAQKHNAEDLPITVLTEPRLGASCARNCGLRAAATEWTMFFDSDDIMMRNHIERAMHAITANPDADIIGWDCEMVQPNGAKRNMKFEQHHMLYNNLFHGTMATLRYIARTELFRRAGGWNEDVSVWDDIELGTRLLTLNPNVVKVTGDSTVLVEAREDSISGTTFASRIDNYQPALDGIRKALPDECKHWVELKKVIIGAKIVNEGYDVGNRLYAEAMQATDNARLRRLLRLAYHYTVHGGRGIARLLRPLV
jgi:glycosyltransferase involved in cell wall biosynthesis